MQSNVTITGYLGQTPEVRETPSGKRVASVRIAINDRRLGDDARWVAVDQWDDAADRAAKYLVRGQHVTAEGLLDAEIYTDRNGNAQLAWRLRRGYIEYGPKPLDNDSPNGTGEEPAPSGTRQSTPARQTATAAADATDEQLENAYAIAVAMDHAATTDATRTTISALYDHLVDRFGPAVAYETHSRLDEYTRTHIHIDYVDDGEDPFDGQQPEDWEPWEPGQPWAPTEFDDRIG